jgi:hypothetical protein
MYRRGDPEGLRRYIEKVTDRAACLEIFSDELRRQNRKCEADILLVSLSPRSRIFTAQGTSIF